MVVPPNTGLLLACPQIDYCDGGPMGVPRSRDTCHRIEEWVKAHGSQYEQILTVRDIHQLPRDGSILAVDGKDPDYRACWPVHCIDGTHGADYNLHIKNIQHKIRQELVVGAEAHTGTAFSAVLPATGDSLSWVLHHDRVHTLHIAGLMLDTFIKRTALEAADHGFIPVVLIDLCSGRSADAVARAIEVLTDRGVRVQHTSVGAF